MMIYLHPKAVSQFTWPRAPEAGMAGLVLPSPPPPGLLTLLRPGSSSSPPPLPLLLFHLSSSSSFCSFLPSDKTPQPLLLDAYTLGAYTALCFAIPSFLPNSTKRNSEVLQLAKVHIIKISKLSQCQPVSKFYHFLATPVALHFTPVSKSVTRSVIVSD